MNSKLDTLRRGAVTLVKTIAVMAALACASLSHSRADVIFDNSVNDLNQRFDPRGLEIGDEIQASGSARLVQTFSFEYWGDSTAPGVFFGDVQARVRFYRNDGQLFSEFHS